MKNWCKYIFLLTGLVVLVHVIVPHHHHADEILFEVSPVEHHEHSGNFLDEQVIGAATVEQDADAICFECVCSPATSTSFTFSNLEAKKQQSYVSVYLNSLYSYFVCHSGGLRAPPVC